MKIRVYTKNDPLIPLKSEPKEGANYHVVWGRSHGVLGKVKSIDYENRTVVMISPRTKIQWKNPVKWSDLRHTRKIQYKIEHGKPPHHP
jgi:hypothetical protein